MSTIWWFVHLLFYFFVKNASLPYLPHFTNFLPNLVCVWQIMQTNTQFITEKLLVFH